MKRAITTLTGSSLLFLALSVPAFGSDEIRYNRDIRPILSDKCFFCHGPDPETQEADLRLDIESAAKESVIVPGKPEESEFVFRLTDTEDLMPPEKSHKKLTEKEIALLTRWVKEGAPYEAFWAYEPPVKHPLPEGNNEAESWIDRFILARLKSENLKPSPEADPVTLVRRLHFDLTGLPPEPGAVAAFVSAPDKEKAWIALVDKLLASQHFGERMAIYWLDLVRYADTVGYHGDQTHHISPYRDYVIDAFNRNLPFDQFTREQLAGDLLPEPTIEQIIATGYNRLLQTSHEGGVQEKEYLAIYAADRMRNLSGVWMGATLGCAQCHDHKYDPYTMKDFYSMVAFFADVDENAHLNPGKRKGLNFNALPSPRPPEIELPTDEQKTQLAKLQSDLAEAKKTEVKEGDNKEKEEAVKKITAEIAALKKGIRRSMITVSIEPREIRVLPRGNWLDDSGEVVQPAIPEFLGKLEKETGKRLNRLDLANWLMDTEKGYGALASRVFVNRMWFLLMGAGLSKSLDDFGGQGEPPVHPELLDNLAVDFIESGWNVKKLIRTIVLTKTYRQSSIASTESQERDPDNRLYARQSRFRLPAEMVRDNALAVSGLLVANEVGGDSVNPPQPAGYYRHLNFPTRKYQQHTDERQYRRGVYVHWQRQFLHPMLKAFDAPSREECTAERPRSNTPLAALVLLNDPVFVEAAQKLAERIQKEGSANDSERIEFAFREALSRQPDETERKIMGELFTSEGGKKKAEAAWTAVARAILNLNETMTRN